MVEDRRGRDQVGQQPKPDVTECLGQLVQAIRGGGGLKSGWVKDGSVGLVNKAHAVLTLVEDGAPSEATLLAELQKMEKEDPEMWGEVRTCFAFADALYSVLR